jgi:uncharacterized membrane protein HdeD (DUF308 family)
MKHKYEKPIKNILYVMLAIFVLLILYFAIPFFHDMKRGFFLVIAVLGLAFMVLGILLMVFAVKSRPDKKLKVFLILTGASAIGPLAGSILEFLHAAFFILALLVSPVVFLVGAVGSIVMLLKKKRKD